MRKITRTAVALATAGLLGLPGCGANHPASPVEAAAQAATPQLVSSLTAANPALDPIALAQPTPAAPLVVPAAPIQAPDTVAAGNDATLFVGPDETLPAVMHEIETAEKSIYLETFNFGTTYARRLAPQLIAKAQAGVEVRLLIDFTGSRFLKGYDSLVSDLRKGGVDVQVYRPYVFRDPSGHLSFNIVHRKIYLFDGERALIGGVNLASPFDTTTQDLLIRWRGPVLAPLFAEFSHDWKRLSSTPLGMKVVATAAGGVDAQVLVTSPGEGRYEIKEAIFQHIDKAERSILIENQYLWDDQLVARLKAAALRGVKVQVMVPGLEQKSVQRTCNFLALNELVKAGVEARLYDGALHTAHLHTKYFAIDDAWATTGSCNGDTRSLADNQELDVATTNTALIQQLRARLFEKDWADHSVPYVPVTSGLIARHFDTLLGLLDYYM